MSDDEPITPPHLYFNRRSLMRSAGVAASVLTTAGLYRWLNPASMAPPAIKPSGGQSAEKSDATPSSSVAGDGSTPEANPYAIDDAWTPELYITGYNNFYEFTTNKMDVAAKAADFSTDGWKVVVDGLVDKPRTFSMADLLALTKPIDRVYRMRCVEGWSMVIPWSGIPLSSVLEAVQPQSDAAYVAFTTLHDPERMPGQRSPILDWPYIEGLRLDEAMHPLTLLATGLYGKPLPNQDGAPVRLVVPWKYGFKGIKSIVKISLVKKQPETSWNRFASEEYGFYANVNPNVDHPRWSQATEQRIGERGRRKTLLFNGYEEHVAHLYAGMDLAVYY